MEHTQKQCCICGILEQEVPLLYLTYQSKALSLCPQCLPVLIHAPQKLAEKLPGLEKIKVKQHGH